MNRKIVQIFTILVVSSFIFGCHSESRKKTTVVTAEVNEVISATNFQEGVVTQETTINIETKENELLSTVIVKEDTQFENTDGVAITETPLLVVKTTKSEDTSESIIKFTNTKGEVVTPTKPFKVGIKAPAGANPGDRIKVEIPDGSSTQIQKILIRVVDQNGFIFVEITINDLRDATTIITITVLGNGATN